MAQNGGSLQPFLAPDLVIFKHLISESCDRKRKSPGYDLISTGAAGPRAAAQLGLGGETQYEHQNVHYCEEKTMEEFSSLLSGLLLPFGCSSCLECKVHSYRQTQMVQV